MIDGCSLLGELKSSFDNRQSLMPRRGARVVELAALEMLCTGNRTVGSNPTLSARIVDSRLSIAD